MNKQRLWILLARKLADEATMKELIELEYLLSENIHLHAGIEALIVMWKKDNNGFNKENVGNKVTSIIKKANIQSNLQ